MRPWISISATCALAVAGPACAEPKQDGADGAKVDAAVPPNPATIPKSVVDEIEFETRELPGLTLSLPRWPVKVEQLDPASGMLFVDQRPVSQRTYSLNWSLSELVSDDELRAGLGDLMGLLDGATYLGARASGLEVDASSILEWQTKDDLNVSMVGFSCPDDPRVFTLLSLVELSADDARELLTRTLATVRCGPPPDDLGAGYPAFAPGRAHTVTRDGNDSISYVFEGEGELRLYGRQSGASSQAFVESLELRRTVLRAAGLIAIDDGFETDPRHAGTPSRPIWRGRVQLADDETDTFELLMSVLPCELGVHVILYVPAGEDLPADALELTAMPTCDEPSE